MVEREWWSAHVKHALFQPLRQWWAEKTQDAFKNGMPDLTLCAAGRVARCEMKFVKALPKHSRAKLQKRLSPEQARWLAEWASAGGRSWVLLGVEQPRLWFLYDAAVYAAAATYGELHDAALVKGESWTTLHHVMLHLQIQNHR